MTDSLEQGNKSLRPEEAAAIANAGLVLAAPFVLAALLRMNEPERAVVIGCVSGPAPDPMLSWFVRAATSMVPATPMAALATWRTNVHARRVRAGQGRWWQGVAEAIRSRRTGADDRPATNHRLSRTHRACVRIAAAVLFTANRLSRSR